MCTVRRLVTLICLFLLSALAHADVDPPIILQMQPLSGATASSPRVDLIITVSVPVYAGNPESQLRVTVRGDAQARLAGADAWVVNSVVPGYTYTFRTATSVATARSGRVRVEATSYNAQGRKLWSKADELYLMGGTTELLASRSSPLEIERRNLDSQFAAGRLGATAYHQAMRQRINSAYRT